MKPTAGRIVLVRSPTLTRESPAIVTNAADAEDGSTRVNVWVFPDEPHTRRLVDLGPQDQSSKGWGWRWPPREPTVERWAEPLPAASVDPAPALAQEGPLAKV